jgi:hypothetical protein
MLRFIPSPRAVDAGYNSNLTEAARPWSELGLGHTANHTRRERMIKSAIVEGETSSRSVMLQKERQSPRLPNMIAAMLSMAVKELH